MKHFFLAIGFLFSVGLTAQNPAALNHYKYALVPSKFSFLKDKNQYNLNLYTKMHLQKYGFEAYMEGDDLPMEAMINKCNKVYVDLIEDSGMFMTRIKVQFKDCLGNVLFTSEEGSSRQKEYPKAYKEALGNAFKSVATLGYQYDGTTNYISDSPLQPTSGGGTNALPETGVDQNTLFAQPIENGYQLVDKTPSVIFKLQKTSSSDVFMATKGTVSGTLIRKEGYWIFEYYQDGKLLTEKVKVKF